jgi:hypothetical protein
MGLQSSWRRFGVSASGLPFTQINPHETQRMNIPVDSLATAAIVLSVHAGQWALM